MGAPELATSTGAKVTLSIANAGECVDVAAYSWVDKRSPLTAARESLPVLTSNVGDAVIPAAFAAGCTWQSVYDANQERERELESLRPEYEAKVAAGYYTPEAIQAREDEDMVAGTDPSENHAITGGAMGALVAQAWRRIRMRKAAAETAQATTEG